MDTAERLEEALREAALTGERAEYARKLVAKGLSVWGALTIAVQQKRTAEGPAQQRGKRSGAKRRRSKRGRRGGKKGAA